MVVSGSCQVRGQIRQDANVSPQGSGQAVNGLEPIEIEAKSDDDGHLQGLARAAPSDAATQRNENAKAVEASKAEWCYENQEVRLHARLTTGRAAKLTRPSCLQLADLRKGLSWKQIAAREGPGRLSGYQAYMRRLAAVNNQAQPPAEPPVVAMPKPQKPVGQSTPQTSLPVQNRRNRLVNPINMAKPVGARAGGLYSRLNHSKKS